MSVYYYMEYNGHSIMNRISLYYDLGTIITQFLTSMLMIVYYNTVFGAIASTVRPLNYVLGRCVFDAQGTWPVANRRVPGNWNGSWTGSAVTETRWSAASCRGRTPRYSPRTRRTTAVRRTGVGIRCEPNSE